VQVTALEATASSRTQKSRLGLLKEHCQVPDDFDQLGDEVILELFEGH
jgi:hypothetical protein